MLMESLTIPKSPKRLPAEDYEALRVAGLEHIQKLAGKIWTDYNLHDPGVTILELLCYALTDIGYRTSFNIEDLLTKSGDEGPSKDNAFFTPAEILTMHPVTINDYRKLLLDKTPGLRNVWFYTNDDKNFSPAIYYNHKKNILSKKAIPGETEALHLKGLYSIVFETGPYSLFKEEFLRNLIYYRDKTSTKTSPIVEEEELNATIRNYICNYMGQHRNLCEDVQEITPMNEERVAICAEIELLPAAHAEEVWLMIYRLLYDYISPPIPFYNLEEMLAKGKQMEEIFQGSVAERGFVDYDELNTFGHRTVIYTSDIISIIMDIPGVQAIRDIHISSYRQNKSGKFEIFQHAEKYCLHLSDPSQYSFKLALDFHEEDKEKQFNHIHFYKDYIYFSPKHSASYKTDNIISRQREPENFVNDVPLPKGTYRSPDQYISIQNEFPANYLLGQDAVPNSTSTIRKSQRLQLKGYLLFFEQLLANYLAQLSNLSSLFSWDSAQKKTYFYTNLLTLLEPNTGRKEISSIEELIDSYGTGSGSYQEVLEKEGDAEKRRNRFLDHLLARFNEQFTDYSLFKFSQNTSDGFYNSYSEDEMMKGKSEFLKSYPLSSSRRARGFNYHHPGMAPYNLSGLELRIYQVLGINNFHHSRFRRLVHVVEVFPGNPKLSEKGKIQVCDNRQDAFTNAFGLHVLEHILLRPQTAYEDDVLLHLCQPGTDSPMPDCIHPDPYSLKITVVLPGWLAISSDMNWRRFLESRIRQEAPAHVGVKICWLNPVQMYHFENAYTKFTNALLAFKTCHAVPNKAVTDDYFKWLKEVIKVVSGLKNMYPPSALENCHDIGFDQKGNMTTRPQILNRSALSGGAGSEYEFVKC